MIYRQHLKKSTRYWNMYIVFSSVTLSPLSTLISIWMGKNCMLWRFAGKSLSEKKNPWIYFTMHYLNILHRLWFYLMRIWIIRSYSSTSLEFSNDKYLERIVGLLMQEKNGKCSRPYTYLMQKLFKIYSSNVCNYLKRKYEYLKCLKMINYIIKKKQINLISWKQITLIILFKIKFLRTRKCSLCFLYHIFNYLVRWFVKILFLIFDFCFSEIENT